MYLRARIIEGAVPLPESNELFSEDEIPTIENSAFCDEYSQDGYNRIYDLGKKLWDMNEVSEYEIAVFDSSENLVFLVRPDLDDFSKNIYRASFSFLGSEIEIQKKITPFKHFLEDHKMRFWTPIRALYSTRYYTATFLPDKHGRTQDATQQASQIAHLGKGQKIMSETEVLCVLQAGVDGLENRFITTEREWSGLKNEPAFLKTVREKSANAPMGFLVSSQDKTLRASIVDLSNSELAADVLDQFLVHGWTADYSTLAPRPITDAAAHALKALLNPIINADFQERPMPEYGAIGWSHDHDLYVEKVDSILFSLNLLDVVRKRSSVTQGEAEVVCNGRRVVAYGDHICMKKNDVQLTDGFKTFDGTLYGPIIGNWGSATSDSAFRKAAICQYAKLLVGCLEHDPVFFSSKSEQNIQATKTALDRRIIQAANRSNSGSTHMPDNPGKGR